MIHLNSEFKIKIKINIMRFDLSYAFGKFSSKVKEAVSIVPAVDIGFKNFFSEKVYGTEGFNFWVTKQKRSVAVDINRRERANINSLDKSTNQFYVPPTYKEGVIYSAFDQFQTIMGATDGKVEGEIFKAFVQKTADELVIGRQKIERAEELQRAQALLTSGITLKNGDNIVFNRSAALLVAYNAAFGWDVLTVDPGIILKQLSDEMVTAGAVDASSVMNVIVGSTALTAFHNNPIRQAAGDIKDQVFMNLSTGAPIKGLTPQGAYSTGNYRYNLWGYEGEYLDPKTGNPLKYMDPKKIVVLPNSVPFEMVYCGVAGWSDGTGLSPNAFPKIKKGVRNYYKIRDVASISEEIGVESAVLASLNNVDAVGTAQVIAP